MRNVGHASVSRAAIGRRVTGVTIVACALLAAGCESSPYDKLTHIGHAIPTPPGLSFVSDNAHTNDAFPNPSKEVDIKYTNRAMSCRQLHDAWIVALRKARATFDAAPLGIVVKDRGGYVNIDLGQPSERCRSAYVAVQP